jgi:hypothetical protein
MGMSEQTLQCPHCGEMNRPVDRTCWACDAYLHAPGPREPGAEATESLQGDGSPGQPPGAALDITLPPDDTEPRQAQAPFWESPPRVGWGAPFVVFLAALLAWIVGGALVLAGLYVGLLACLGAVGFYLSRGAGGSLGELAGVAAAACYLPPVGAAFAYCGSQLLVACSPRARVALVWLAAVHGCLLLLSWLYLAYAERWTARGTAVPVAWVAMAVACTVCCLCARSRTATAYCA